jgi:TldD protein
MNADRIALPEAMARLRPHLGETVERLETRSPYAAVWLGAHRGMSISIDRQEEQVTEDEPAAGAVLTAFDGKTIRERSIGSFQPDALAAEAGLLAETLSAPNGRRLALSNGLSGRHDFATELEIPPESLSVSEKIDRCRQLQERLAKVDSRVVNTRILYLERVESSVFRDRQADLAQQVHRLRLAVFVIVRQGETVRYNWCIKSASGGWETVLLGDDLIDETVETALRLLEAGRIEPGDYDVVTAPGVSGVICHESFGHGVETDMFVKERARAASYVNQTVASPLVDIFDDPTYPGAYGSYYFDDEGLPAKPTRIVENGVFRGGITDLGSATALGIPRTANGRRQDFGRKAYARMSNTFFGPGSSDFEDLLGAAGDGVFLEKWSSGMEDPQGWGIQVTCHLGREIKNGRLTNRYFSPIAIAGYVPDVLRTVRGVGREVRVEGGTCGKGHKENVPVSSGGPHMLLRAKLG